MLKWRTGKGRPPAATVCRNADDAMAPVICEIYCHTDVEEFINEYENECKCEFIDPRFLATNALDSEHAALDYFYQSPFYLKYRENALNEHIRAGQTVDR